MVKEKNVKIKQKIKDLWNLPNNTTTRYSRNTPLLICQDFNLVKSAADGEPKSK